MAQMSKIGRLKFNYLISIYGISKDPPGLVMEYMRKGSLDNLLSSHLLMWPKKFQMIHEMTMGMNFLHSMKPPILHLNLKPANILLDDHLHMKVSQILLLPCLQNVSEFISGKKRLYKDFTRKRASGFGNPYNTVV